MIIYEFWDEDGNRFAATSLRKAKAMRAKNFDRADRPEIMRVDIGQLTHQRACDLLMGVGYAESMEDAE